MKTKRILAVALSAGLILSGGVAHAQDAPAPKEYTKAKDQKEFQQQNKKLNEELAAAKAPLNDAKKAIEENEENLSSKKNAVLAATDAYNTAYSKALLAVEKTDDKETAEDYKKRAEEAAKADAAVKKAETELEAAKKAVTDAEKAIKDNKAKLPELEKAVKEVEEKIANFRKANELPQWKPFEEIKPYVTEKFYTKDAAKEAAYTEKKNIELEGLSETYDVEIHEQKNADGSVNYYIRRVLKENKPEEKKPEVKPNPDKKPEVKPEVKPAPTYDYEYPLIKPGKIDEEITLPKLEESKEVEKEVEAKEKETTEVKEKSKAKENKKKEVKEVKKQAPARQAGRKNPKTGLESVAPVLSTLAISMAGIVATRKKNN